MNKRDYKPRLIDRKLEEYLNTFAVCVAGVMIGRKFGVRLADKAAVLGGIILISIGLKMVLL